MKRKIYATLLDWKRTSSGKSAIMLDGARRVGKSYIAEEFAKNEYSAYLLIDFAKATRRVKGFFEDYLDDTPYVLHKKDVSEKDGVTFLPLYMAPLLVRRT